MHRPAPYHVEEACSPALPHGNAVGTPFIKAVLHSSKLNDLMCGEQEFPPQHTEQPKRGPWWDGGQVWLLTRRR